MILGMLLKTFWAVVFSSVKWEHQSYLPCEIVLRIKWNSADRGFTRNCWINGSHSLLHFLLPSHHLRANTFIYLCVLVRLLKHYCSSALMGISQWYKCIRSRSILKKKRVFYEWINVMSSVRVTLRWKNTKEAVSDVLFLEWSFRLIHSGKGRGKGRGQTDLSLETPAVAAWRAFRDPSAWNVGN